MIDFEKLRTKIFRNNRSKIIEFKKNNSSLESEWFNFEIDAEFDEIIINMNSTYRKLHDSYNNLYDSYKNIYDEFTKNDFYYINIQYAENEGNEGNDNTENEGNDNTENKGNDNTENKGNDNTENKGNDNTENT